MDVYARYFTEDGFKFRKNTILKFGDSHNWELIGNIVLINPGSAKPMIEEGKEKEIEENALKEISRLQNLDKSEQDNWYQFKPDPTMQRIEMIFNGAYLQNNEMLTEKKELNGVIQLFNLFNLRDQNLHEALAALKSSKSNHLFSTERDISLIQGKPTYLGWGNAGKDNSSNPELRQKAEQIFNAIVENNDYLHPTFSDNPFYHPTFINRSIKRYHRSQQLLHNFYFNRIEYLKQPILSESKPIISNVKLELVDKVIQDIKANESNFKSDNGFLNIELNDSKLIRLSFKGNENDILSLTITSKDKGFIGIRASTQAKGKDFNADLKCHTHYIELLEQFNFSENTSWLGRKAIKDLKLPEGSIETPEKLIDCILTEVNKFREKLKIEKV